MISFKIWFVVILYSNQSKTQEAVLIALSSKSRARTTCLHIKRAIYIPFQIMTTDAKANSALSLKLAKGVGKVGLFACCLPTTTDLLLAHHHRLAVSPPPPT